MYHRKGSTRIVRLLERAESDATTRIHCIEKTLLQRPIIQFRVDHNDDAEIRHDPSQYSFQHVSVRDQR